MKDNKCKPLQDVQGPGSEGVADVEVEVILHASLM
jgi:hypothetical protein